MIGPNDWARWQVQQVVNRALDRRGYTICYALLYAAIAKAFFGEDTIPVALALGAAHGDRYDWLGSLPIPDSYVEAMAQAAAHSAGEVIS